jgi:hypothetical protein
MKRNDQENQINKPKDGQAGEPPLDQEIRCAYDRLIKALNILPTSVRTLKVIDATGGKVSASDLIAYQIGWGKCVIQWYEAGMRGENPELPGEGFSTWNYTAIAHHFYKKYHYDGLNEQMKVFQEVVSTLLEIVETEHQANRLDQTNVWTWCTLSSGKHWPLSKWIRVNTVSPYKRAAQLIKKAAQTG